jgi:multidrug efflux pump
VTGVGLVSIAGGQKPSVRIQANPAQLASYNLSLEDLRTAIAAANVDQAKGTLNGVAAVVHDRRQRPVAYELRLQAGGDCLPQRRPGARLRCGFDRGRPENNQQAAWMNRTPAVIVNIQRQPGANIIAVVDRIHKLLPQLQTGPARLGPGEGADRPHLDHSRLGQGRGV